MPANNRKLLLLACDAAVINAALLLALLVRFEFSIPHNYITIYYKTCLLITAIKIAAYIFFGLYRSLWEYASIDELLQLILASIAADGLAAITGILLNIQLPYSVYFTAWVFSFIGVGFIRFSYRILRRFSITENRSYTIAKRIMIYGAGTAGSSLIKELKNQKETALVPVLVFDDNRRKNRTRINGVPVYSGRERIPDLVLKYSIDEIIIAIPSAPKKTLHEILSVCKKTGCVLKKLPSVYELMDNKVSAKQLREVNIEDLLGREEVKLDTGVISGYLQNETVLVTGGGGSIGSELCRQIARFRPKKLIIFDIYENNAYDLQNELLSMYKGTLDLEVLIGSVRDRIRLKEVFEKYRPGVVFHAAAHKHVPLMEGNPGEAVKNNVFGTLNTARRADDYGAKKFILVSTDKAVNPTNIMGASKRLAEIIIQSMNRHSKTKFAAVRFGNVLGSNGSVIPLFKRQIAQGGPVTVTHPDIIRYFMTIPEAAQLVIQSGAMAKGGEVFVLDMGDPIRIDDLAHDLIRLSGLQPDVDIKIEYSGLRPGEKLYEELMMAEEGLESTAHSKIFVGKQADMSFQEVIMYIKALESSMESEQAIRECMCRLVPTYRSSEECQLPQEEKKKQRRHSSKKLKLLVGNMKPEVKVQES